MAHGTYDFGELRQGAAPAGRESSEVKSRRSHQEVSLRLELLESQACWYELLFNPPEWDAKRTLIDRLRTLQATVASTPVAQQHGQSDHGLVCFWGARTKVRFCMQKSPRFTLLSNDFVFYVELGRNRTRRKLTTTFVDAHTGRAVRPHIELSESYITIHLPGEESERVSIYDFLRKCGLELEINSTIHAVEYTHAPLSSWLGGSNSNRHLAQMLYNVSNEEHDFFLYCNLFKVTLMQMESQLSSVTGHEVWEVSTQIMHQQEGTAAGAEGYFFPQQERGALIEKAFESYFQLNPLPNLHRSNQAAAHAPTYSIQVLMDLDNSHELYRFSSESIEAADKHMFSCEIKGDKVLLSVLI